MKLYCAFFLLGAGEKMKIVLTKSEIIVYNRDKYYSRARCRKHVLQPRTILTFWKRITKN